MSQEPSVQKPIHYDPLLLSVCIVLLMMGYIMMFSSSLHLKEGMGWQILHYPIRQLLFIGLGLGLAWAVTMIPMKFWQWAGPYLFVFGLVLLLLVLNKNMGVEVNGSRRWLMVAGIRVQVSELMKLFAVLYMAGYLVRHQVEMRESQWSMFRPLVLLSIASGLLLLEPDFGSAFVIMSIAMSMMYLSGVRLKQFLVLLVLLTCVGAYVLTIERYRLDRLLAYLNPWADVSNTGYQLVQSLVSFGRGEIFGVGIGNGIQKLFYVPEGHTDFIFSIVGEELGLVGVLTIIVLYSLLVWKGFNIARMAENQGQHFSAYTAYGISIWIGYQAFINMGVNMGVLPTKGITLPLMSYGGGSMIIVCMAIAIVFRVQLEAQARHKQQEEQVASWLSAL